MSDNLPPSMQKLSLSWLPTHFWSWLIVLCGIIFLLYAARAIAQEKKRFHQDGDWMDWHDLKLFIPAWWTLNLERKNTCDELHFYRADTRYDWYFSLKFFPKKSISDLKNEYFQNELIVADDDAVITTEKSFLLQDSVLLKSITHFLRIETTATEKEEERIYLDVSWIQFDDERTLQCLSKSSVLNGGIEGPYVEEVIKGIKFRN